ncbi:restriction endonuclease subunit S [Flavobacterium sp. ASW18X]|uniref:restriction endonuclease subunit S n=1 Tax=Flavobacterium sp. ASW18X TaxID=2572595 RepID=UPI0010ADBE61|nr:restriction endonuclease subunit S [Flavobacterium sp. ASW18X]TKD58978.1 restriction endonuclease subunit S [Flavobacterium sp. ASW18X]
MKKLKQYPEYYDSEVEWLRYVPSHWEVVKSKRIFVETSIKGFPDEELLAATQTKGVIPKSLYGNTTVTATKNFETLKLVEKGDFVISLRSFQGGIEYAHYRGIISPAYTILKPQEEVVHKYYRYLLKSKRYISGLTLLVTGIREGQNIDTSKFKDSYLPLPPKQEQTIIANFLDYKTEKINRFIKKKKQLIELLNEQKAAIINQAVTKGINPNAPMKDSGIEWLGEIPEHWQVSRFKNICKVRQGLQIAQSDRLDSKEDNCYEYITIKSINNPTNPKEYIQNPSKNVICAKDDILVSRTGSTGEIVTNVEGVFHNNFFLVNYYRNKVKKEFLFYYLTSSLIKEHLLLVAGTTTVSDLNHGEFYKTPFFEFPLEEQKQIVNYIETETQKITKTISTIEKEITLVEEYKTALIAEAVTGKIDVIDFKLPTQETPLAMVAEEAANYNKR